jgi:hypothetical protein
MDMQILGIEGRAELLRQLAKGLDMDVNDIIPSADKLKAQQMAMAQQQMAMQQQQMAAQQPPAPQGTPTASPAAQPQLQQ